MAFAACWTMLAVTPAAGDDTELFVTDSRRFAESRPNVLLIVDTSASLAGEVQTQGRFDQAVQYAGHCDSSRIYWRTGIGAPPQCPTDRWFERTALVCRSTLDAFNGGNGSHTDRFARFDAAGGGRWNRLDERQKDQPVECQDDGGRHGNGSDPLAVFARNGNVRRAWSTDPRDEIAWGQRPADRLYTVYDANYLNWYHGPRPVSGTRHYVLQDVATTLLTGIDGVNVGLMATNFDQGGSILHAIEDIDTARATLIDTVRGLTAEGGTPLAETLYEAGQYFAGRAVVHGDGPGSQVSVSRSRDPDGGGIRYASPMRLGCQKNFIVLLTDGVPVLDVDVDVDVDPDDDPDTNADPDADPETDADADADAGADANADADADARIVALPGFSDAVGPACDGTGDGACLDDMAAYLFAADLDPSNPGKQNVITYVVGFTADDPLLEATARRGGGAYFTTAEAASLAAALTNAVTSIRETQTAFAAMTVPVDSFNRLRNGDELYLAVFRAAANAHWPGNIRKYRLRGSDGAILDARGLPAIDPLGGWFQPDSRSFWSTEADGEDVASGGAAARIPDPASRNVHTYLGEPQLTHPDNALQRSNGLIDEALLGIGDPGDPSRDEVIDFIRGSLTARTRQPGEQPSRMGDPLHGRPVAVTYGGTVENSDPTDQVIYAATNDGFLHAIDAQTGTERWAFIPPEFLQDQSILRANDATPDKRYGIDGTIRAHVQADDNGVIEPGEGERVYLFFGMRRGGTSYYGLDVTLPGSPRVLWRLDAGALPGLGQSWSTPVPARVRVRGAAQNARSLVLVIGGGYDPGQDRLDGNADRQGNALYIVDALDGHLLWHAAPSGSNFDTADMQYSIPADVRVIDLDIDGFADRLYAADMGGQVWRFDVFNGRPAASLISGGVIARLGGAPDAAPPAAVTRRFYNAPDVALAGVGTQRFIHIGIGSGHRARPNSPATRDRFFALRDHAVFESLAQSEYEAMTPIASADLVDITGNLRESIPFASPGWRLELNDGGWRGEKVLAESRTFNNQVFLTTFTPAAEAQGSSENCQPVIGTNRLYIVNLFNGDPVRNLDGLGEDSQLAETDRFLEVPGPIPGEAVFLFPPAEDPDCAGPECAPPPLACVGLLCLPSGFDNAPVRTYWRQETG